jgi:hypothetical protein
MNSNLLLLSLTFLALPFMIMAAFDVYSYLSNDELAFDGMITSADAAMRPRPANNGGVLP